MAFAEAVVHNRVLALGVVAVVVAATTLSAWRYLPKLEYLPEGNRNLVFGVLIPPPGYNLATMTEIAEEIETEIRRRSSASSSSRRAPAPSSAPSPSSRKGPAS